MDAVILASGEGVRMRPLTEMTPKPLLPLLGKPIIEHLLIALPASVERVILVVNYLGDQFKARYGHAFEGREFVYVQGSSEGNAIGFRAAEPYVRGERFLVAYADDLPSVSDVARCVQELESVLCFKDVDPQAHGMVVMRSDGTVEGIVEKPAQFEGDVAVNGLMVLKRDIFAVSPKKTAGGEYHFSALLDQYAGSSRIVPVISEGLIWGISTPADLTRAEEALRVRYATV